MAKNKELLKFNENGQWELLEKAVGQVNQTSSRKNVNTLPAGWSADASTGSLHHSTHGVIGTSKHPDGYYEVKHSGRNVGRANSIQEAGAKIHNYIKTLGPKDTGMHNIDPMKVGKNDDHMDLQCAEDDKEKKDA